MLSVQVTPFILLFVFLYWCFLQSTVVCGGYFFYLLAGFVIGLFYYSIPCCFFVVSLCTEGYIYDSKQLLLHLPLLRIIDVTHSTKRDSEEILQNRVVEHTDSKNSMQIKGITSTDNRRLQKIPIKENNKQIRGNKTASQQEN
jgi:hypothetical protein